MKQYVLLAVSSSLVILGGTIAKADLSDPDAMSSNVYNINATCASSGVFTAKALEQTRAIRGVISRLKNNPACQGLGESLETAIKGVGENLQTIQDTTNTQPASADPNKLSDFSSVGDQLQTLRTFSNTLPISTSNAPDSVPSFSRSSVFAALSATAMKTQRLQSVANGAPDIDQGSTGLTKEIARAILGSKDKIRVASMTGLNIINSTMDSIQNAQENCLDPSSSAFVTSALTQTVAAFLTSGGSNLSNQVTASTVNKLVTYLSRDKKYISAIRSLNQAEFYTTLSCLVEMTSEGYCATEDAQMLLTEVKKDYDFVVKTEEPTTKEKEKGSEIGVVPKSKQVVEPRIKNFASLLKTGPMAGHYILAHQLPIITDWISKIQFGNEPQLDTEATFQVNAYNASNAPFTRWKILVGNYNKAMSQLPGLTSLAAKQNLVLQMLLNMTGGLTEEGDTVNFFIRAEIPIRMPFTLIGMDPPSEVMEAKNNQVMDPTTYLNINYSKLAPFQDPEKLAVTIKRNAENIYKQADIFAQAYLMQFFIPDEVAIVSESMVGMNKGDVRSALQEVDLYVADFMTRMSEEGGDPAMLSIADGVRRSIGIILAHYKQMHEFGLKMIADKKAGRIRAKDADDKMTTMARGFIQDVYDALSIKKMRGAWLQNRMMTIVKKDYSMAMQKRSFSNKQLQDLLLATGLESLQQLFGEAGVNFGTAQMDLAQARDLYKTNLDALEQVATVPMQNYINEQRLKADGHILTQRDLWIEANKYAYNRQAEKVPTDNANLQWWRSLLGAANNVVEGLTGGFGLIGKDVKYGWPAGGEIFNSKLPNLIQSDDGSSEKIWGKNCALILAFQDLRPFWYLCKKATLFSPFADDTKYASQPQVANFINNDLSLNFVKAAYDQLDPNANYTATKDQDKPEVKKLIARNYRSRVCALRTYYRKNYVMQVTAGLKRDSATDYTTSYTSIPDRPVAATTTVPAPIAPDNLATDTTSTIESTGFGRAKAPNVNVPDRGTVPVIQLNVPSNTQIEVQQKKH
jgi:hypothetical protein